MWPSEKPGASRDALLLLQPTLHAHGKTVKQCLDELIDRRRLMTWWVSSVDPDRLYLNVRTFNKAQIDLPSGEIIAANTDQQTLLLDDHSYYADLHLTKDSAMDPRPRYRHGPAGWTGQRTLRDPRYY